MLLNWIFLSRETKTCWLRERFQITLVVHPETFAMILEVLVGLKCAKLRMNPAETKG